MNEHVSFERFVADQFASVDRVAPPRHHVDHVLAEARRTRPLPRWLALIKEPPMRLSSRVAVGSPTVRLMYLMVLTLLLGLLAVGGVVAGASLLPSPAPVIGCGQVFCPGGPLTAARAFHRATPLLDGSVLVTGGQSRPDDTVHVDLNIADLWDGKTETSSRTGPLREARSFHSATLLPDGRVLVVGSLDNYNGSVLETAEIWDPKTGTFTATGPLAVSRGMHTATVLTDGQVLIIGGLTTGYGGVPAVELWDPRTETFGPAGSLAQPRSGHTATPLSDGRVLVVGGGNSPGAHFDSAELWDPASVTVSPAASLIEGRSGHTATALPDGRVLVIGGSGSTGYLASSEIWDPATQAFGPTGSLDRARGNHTATLLPDGRVLVIGGEADSPDGYLASAEIWDPASGSFSPAGSLAEGRFAHTATPLEDGRVLISGGWVNGIPEVYTDSTEIWDPRALASLTTSPSPTT